MMAASKHLIVFVFVVVSIQVRCGAAANCGSSQSQCEPIEADLCLKLSSNYNKTKFPTKRFDTQEEALLQFNSYAALFRSNCSEKLGKFLCAYYFPPCVQSGCVALDYDIEVGPCPSLCTEVQSKCEPVLKAHNHTWKFNCSQLPPPCINASDTTQPAHNISNSIAPAIDTCQPIKKNSACASLHHSYKTFFPNAKFDSQKDADLHFTPFTAYINHSCSDKLSILLCSSHYPVCVENVQNSSNVSVLYPCKRVCKQVKKNCEPLFTSHNVSWPEMLNCGNFPKNELCIDEAAFDQMTPLACEPIDPRVQNVCGVLNQTYMTHFPHGKFNTQSDAYEEFKTYLPIIEKNCSAELLAFLCYNYFPSCSPAQAKPKIPCRSVCRKARTGCKKCFEQDGSIKKWPDEFNCEDNYQVNKNCISLKDIDKYRSTFVSHTCNAI